MPNWFEQNAPQTTRRTGNWFEQNAPDAAIAVSDEGDFPDPPEPYGQSPSMLSRIGHALGSGGDFAATTIDQLWNKKDSFGGALEKGLAAAKDINSTTTDFDQVLGNAGYEKGFGRAAAGFVGDFFVDPLNLIGGLPTKMLSKAGVKLPSMVAKMAGGSDELVGTTGRLLKTAGTKIEELPIMRDVLDKFVQHRGLGTTMSNVNPALSYRDIRRLGDSSIRHASENAAEKVNRLLGDLDLDQAKEISFALDEGKELADPVLKAKAKTARALLDRQVRMDKKTGSLYADHNVRPNYVPRYATEWDNSHARTQAALHGITKMDSLGPKKEILPYKTLREAVDAGVAVGDIREIVGKRMAEGAKANKAIEFMGDAVKHFGSTEAKEGFRRLRMGDLDRSFLKDTKKMFENVYFPEKIAKDLEKTVVLWNKDTQTTKILGTAAKLWRTLALSAPGHQFTNLLGNIANMNLGGMDMISIGRTYPKAVKWAQTMSEKKGARVPYFGVKGVDDTAISQALREYEIIGTSTQLGELAAERNALKYLGGKWNPLNPDSKIYQGPRKMGQRYIEEPARIAFFVDQIKKGASIEQAALKTKEILFDYGELTDAERKIRNFVPFYTWTRKNLPLYMKSLITSPERVERHKDFLQLFQNAGDGEEFAQPEYLTESGYVPSPIGSPSGDPAMMRMALPMHDLGLLPNGLSWEDMQKSGQRVAGMLAPWVKTPIEFATDEDIQSGVPISRSTGLSSVSPLAKLLHPIPGMDTLTGVQDTPTGLKQHDRTAYLMRQLPGMAWMGRAIPGVQEDDPLTMGELPQWYESLGTIAGLNPRLINAQNEDSEMKKRMEEYKKMIRRSLEP